MLQMKQIHKIHHYDKLVRHSMAYKNILIVKFRQEMRVTMDPSQDHDLQVEIE
jgi:hypothetical protein